LESVILSPTRQRRNGLIPRWRVGLSTIPIPAPCPSANFPLLSPHRWSGCQAGSILKRLAEQKSLWGSITSPPAMTKIPSRAHRHGPRHSARINHFLPHRNRFCMGTIFCAERDRHAQRFVGELGNYPNLIICWWLAHRPSEFASSPRISEDPNVANSLPLWQARRHWPAGWRAGALPPRAAGQSRGLRPESYQVSPNQTLSPTRQRGKRKANHPSLARPAQVDPAPLADLVCVATKLTGGGWAGARSGISNALRIAP
jgi:hypothetical protein